MSMFTPSFYLSTGTERERESGRNSDHVPKPSCMCVDTIRAMYMFTVIGQVSVGQIYA